MPETAKTRRPADLVRTYAAPVPRYTSYPTVPHFSPNVGDVPYVSWLAALPAGARLSLYVHIPFCHRLFWYCGCNTKATHRYAPVAAYLQSLLSEIANVAAVVLRPHTVSHIHWGGGSPNILAASDIADLAEALRANFNVDKAAEFAVELELEPDRIAVFGYAHLPERMKHQRLLPADMLPSALERFAQSSRLARRLAQAGYVRVGLDHFAKPRDRLASEAIARNFQGYTTDQADALLGIGASAIGHLPEGYMQNAVAVADDERRVRAYGLATARGLALTSEDKMRGHVIERLMCDLTFTAADLTHRFGRAADAVIGEAEALIEADRSGLIERTADGFRVTERGRPFIRSICACFDAYLDHTTARHAAGV